MELSFANGVQEYTVHGVKGDVIIRFNPTDGAFIQRLYNAFDTLDKKQEKYAQTRFSGPCATGRLPGRSAGRISAGRADTDGGNRQIDCRLPPHRASFGGPPAFWR